MELVVDLNQVAVVMAVVELDQDSDQMVIVMTLEQLSLGMQTYWKLSPKSQEAIWGEILHGYSMASNTTYKLSSEECL
jgi:hypothetical protein